MRRIIYNISLSTAPLMVTLRNLLIGAFIAIGIARLRAAFLHIISPDNFTQSDIMQVYLMAKALLSDLNPYLPLTELTTRFIGVFPYFPHPAPYPPINAFLFSPLTLLKIHDAIILWFFIELGFLAIIAIQVSLLFFDRRKWINILIIFFLLLSFYPVMSDLALGQMSILITLCLLSALFALQKGKSVLAGIVIGFSVAIKMITWPIIIYLLLKKEWRAAIVSGITALSVNLIALLVVGQTRFTDYYLHISSQVIDSYHKLWLNSSLFTIGYRIFEGTNEAIFGMKINSAPLINFPTLAPYVSIGFICLFTIISFKMAYRIRDLETSYAIVVTLLVAISPIVWDHYFVITIISLLVILRNLIRQSFPNTLTSLTLIIFALIFSFNDQIGNLITKINGGGQVLQANGGQVTFTSSLLAWLPMLELVGIIVILWRSGSKSIARESVSAQSQSPAILPNPE